MNEPVAWAMFKDNTFMDAIHPDEHTRFEGGYTIPLYTHPAKYCPSENNEAYEKGFIDGMAKMTESAVHRAVEGMSAKTLTDEEILREAYYILMREQQRKAQEK
jgi:hypothetical protein